MSKVNELKIKHSDAIREAERITDQAQHLDQAGYIRGLEEALDLYDYAELEGIEKGLRAAIDCLGKRIKHSQLSVHRNEKQEKYLELLCKEIAELEPLSVAKGELG